MGYIDAKTLSLYYDILRGQKVESIKLILTKLTHNHDASCAFQ